MTYRVDFNSDGWSIGGAKCSKDEAFEFILHGKAKGNDRVASKIINSIERKGGR